MGPCSSLISGSLLLVTRSIQLHTWLTDIARTLYWMEFEVIYLHNGNQNNEDIWSFRITALELACGSLPLSNLLPSKSLLLKITKRFWFSDYETHNKAFKNKKFSEAFKDLVGSCLNQDQGKRSMAERLLRNLFFINCRGGDSLMMNVLLGFPSVEERFKKKMKMMKGSW
ncbi:hypothetical protein ACFX2K_022476 [Malus domestica]